MVIIVASANEAEVIRICKELNVEATTIGEITDDTRLTVTWRGERVCDMSMESLFDGLPEEILEAEWAEPVAVPIEIHGDPLAVNWKGDCLAVIGNLNVCSKEPIVRMYDHGVQGTNALPPFTGVHLDGPNDAVVLAPLAGKPYGMVVSHGMNPVLNELDPYWGSISAFVEAVANYVCVGGNPDEMGLIDNFIWPVPSVKTLGSLDRAVDGCVTAMDTYHRGVVSGKDSLGSTYRSGSLTITIPPVVCISAFGRIPDVMKTQTADFKKTGSVLVLFGNIDCNLGGSVYAAVKGYTGGVISKPDLNTVQRTHKRVQELITAGKILAAKDVHRGGLFATIAKMCFGGDCGAFLDLSSLRTGKNQHPAFLLFSQTPGCILAEMRREDLAVCVCDDIDHTYIGSTKPGKTLNVAWKGKSLFEVSVDELKYAWQAPMRKVFHEA